MGPESKIAVFLHFVWATKYREPLITPEIEQEMYRVIGAQVRKLRCEIIALGGTADHVHLLIRLGRMVSLGQFMHDVKGTASKFVNARFFGDKDRFFRWQNGYGVFSVSHPHVPKVAAYVNNQKAHHASGKIWLQWEDTGVTEEAEGHEDDTETEDDPI